MSPHYTNRARLARLARTVLETSLHAQRSPIGPASAAALADEAGRLAALVLRYLVAETCLDINTPTPTVTQ